MSIQGHATLPPPAVAGNAGIPPAPGRRRIRSILLVLAVLAASPVQAADLSFESGPSWSGKSGLGSTHAGFIQVASDRGFITLRDRIQVNPVVTFGVVASRDESIDCRDVWLVGAGARIKRAARNPGYWFWESQVFFASKDTPSLSGHLQFGNGIGYAHRAWELKVRHISNAGLHEPNHGETMLLVGYRF